MAFSAALSVPSTAFSSKPSGPSSFTSRYDDHLIPQLSSINPFHLKKKKKNHSADAVLRRFLCVNSSLPKATPTAFPAVSPANADDDFVSRFGPDEPRHGADVLVEALERQGVTNVFAYPGGASLEIHQALTRSNVIKNVLPRHEQGGIFAAEGYARASGLPGVCIATSGPGATNLVSGLADAILDSTPIIAITGQVGTAFVLPDVHACANMPNIPLHIILFVDSLRLS